MIRGLRGIVKNFRSRLAFKRTGQKQERQFCTCCGKKLNQSSGALKGFDIFEGAMRSLLLSRPARRCKKCGACVCAECIGRGGNYWGTDRPCPECRADMEVLDISLK